MVFRSGARSNASLLLPVACCLCLLPIQWDAVPVSADERAAEELAGGGVGVVEHVERANWVEMLGKIWVRQARSTPPWATMTTVPGWAACWR